MHLSHHWYLLSISIQPCHGGLNPWVNTLRKVVMREWNVVIEAGHRHDIQLFSSSNRRPTSLAQSTKRRGYPQREHRPPNCRNASGRPVNAS
ncbi:hypothetical protein C8F01DRAFT_1153106 [Mycena amicta]|nr:hypothetical protein C8F01DRAFT_1153106 [Mycena amicta]